ncbi:hypothetical protein MRX96_034324 [Rhipicephalus microplus]
MASGSLRSSRRHNVQYTKASSTSRSLRKSPSGSHKSTRAHQWTNYDKYHQYYYYDKQLRADWRTSIFIEGRKVVLHISLVTPSAELIQSTPSSTTATIVHPTRGFCYETCSDEQCKMNKINSTFLCHCQCQASGTLNQAIQLAMNYPCEDVFPDSRNIAVHKMIWQKRPPTSWSGNPKCCCRDKTTERFKDISPKNNVDYGKSSGRDFDDCNATQDLNHCKGTLFQYIAKISKNQKMIISVAIPSAVRLHAGINDFSIILQDVLRTTSGSDSNGEHTPMGVAYKLGTMNGQPQPILLWFSHSDRSTYYASVLTCVVLKPKKYTSLPHIGTVDTDRKFIHPVLIKVQPQPACLCIWVVISVTTTEFTANDQDMKVIEFRAILTTGYNMSYNMAENYNEMRLWTLRNNPSEKRSGIYNIVLSSENFDICPNQSPLPGPEEMLLIKQDKFSLSFSASPSSQFMSSELYTTSEAQIDDVAIVAYIKPNNKNAMEDSTNGSTLKHHGGRNIHHQTKVWGESFHWRSQS